MSTKGKVSIVGGVILVAVISYSAMLLQANQRVLQSSVKVLQFQEAIAHTNKMSSSLGNMQSYFKVYVLKQTTQNRDSLENYRKLVETELSFLMAYSKDKPALESVTKTLEDEFRKNTQLVADELRQVHAKLSEQEVLTIYNENNDNTNIVWAVIEEVKKQQGKLLYDLSSETKDLSLLPFRLALGASLMLLVIFIWAYRFLARTFKKQLIAERNERESDNQRKVHQQLLQYVIDNSPAIIYIKDVTGRYTLINKRFKQLMNLEESQIIGKMHSELIGGNYVQYKQSDETRIVESGESVEVLESIYIYREKRDFLTTKFPLRDLEGKVFGVGGISTDITERTRYENELKQARKIAEEAKSSQERFLANMSHEIRTPVNNVIGISNLLESTKLDDEQREYFNIIRQSSNMLVVIVNDILDLSKIRSGMLDINKEEINLTDLVRQIALGFRSKAEQKGIALRCVFDEKLPDRLLCDPIRVSQILSNLINNSIKFTSEGEVRVELATVSVEENMCLINFSVVDTGIGIQKNKLELIFNSFTQSNSTIGREYGGTGLGLTIVRELAQLMGGKVSVESEVGRGSKFEVKMPMPICNANNPAHLSGENEPELFLTGKSILVVEDNLLNQSVARQTLQRAGADVEVADNGFVALFLLKEKTFDVVLMDMYMADMDGVETTLKIRNDLKLTTPVIALTAAAMKEDQEMCMKAGMNGYVTKPFVADQLLKTILSTLSPQ